jgi:plastocyanin
VIWWAGAFLALLGLPEGSPTARRVVEIRGMAFHPSVLQVAPGDTVVWINRDILSHDASGPGGWTTGVLAPGDSGRYVMGRGAELRFFCSLHPTMRGSLRPPG